MVGLWQPGFPTLWQPRLDKASGKSFDARGPRGLEAVGSFARLKHDRITLYIYIYLYRYVYNMITCIYIYIHTIYIYIHIHIHTHLYTSIYKKDNIRLSFPFGHPRCPETTWALFRSKAGCLGFRRARRVAVNGFDGAWMDKNWNRTLKNSSAQSSDCVSRGAPLRVPFASCCWLHRQAASTVRALRKPRVKGTSNSNAWVRLKPTSPCW